MKKLCSLVLILSLLIALPVFSLADGSSEVTLSSSAELADHVFSASTEPLGITRATLDTGNGPEEIYLISLLGTGYEINKANNFVAYLLSTVSIGSSYLRIVKNAAIKQIPEGSKVLLAGHSLGGTTAQLFASDKTMRARYDILGVVAFGSPIVVTSEREGFLHRLADRSDLIPLGSLAGPLNFTRDVSFEKGGFGILFITAHTESYRRDSIWHGYDCLGVKGGHAVIRYDPADLVSYSLSLIKF